MSERTESIQKPALYLVGTPIGNLQDVTLRALDVLKQVDLIACEDTRQTQKLLNHYGIENRCVSYHEHNELTRSAELQMKLTQGMAIAVVTDAGMPGISDPGYRLVALAVRHKIPVIPIPGAAAFLSALVASGLPTDAFRFGGFLPSKLGQRRKVLEDVKNSAITQVFYEAPHRLLGALEDIVDVLGPNRHVVVARELTKVYEEFVRGRAAEVLADFKKREVVLGEIVLMFGKAEEAGQPVVAQKNARQRVRELMKTESLDEKEAMKRVAREMGVSKSEVYRELQKGK
jgi:16S rRNA (cytidine1402-2'-O)-methyltransferase